MPEGQDGLYKRRNAWNSRDVARLVLVFMFDAKGVMLSAMRA